MEKRRAVLLLLYRYTEANMESILDRYTEANIECSDMSTCIQHSLLSHLLSLLCLKQWQASDVEEEEEEKHISLYRQHRLWGPWVGDSFTTSWCRGRRWRREDQYYY